MFMNSLCSHGTDLAPSVSRLQFVALPLLLPRAKTLGQTHRAWSRGWLAFATAPGTAICAHRAIAIASPGTSNAYAGPLVILNARIYPLAIWTDLSYFPRHHRASWAQNYGGAYYAAEFGLVWRPWSRYLESAAPENPGGELRSYALHLGDLARIPSPSSNIPGPPRDFL